MALLKGEEESFIQTVVCSLKVSKMRFWQIMLLLLLSLAFVLPCNAADNDEIEDSDDEPAAFVPDNAIILPWSAEAKSGFVSD